MLREKLLTLSPKIRSNIIPLMLGVIGLILLSYGLISSLGSSAEPEEDIVFESSDEKASETKILIDIQGAVVSPGVYSIDANARIKDALIAASGLSSEADREWVAKNLNQAAKVSDGAKIYIPGVGEVGSGMWEAGNAGIQTSDLININSASQGELESLPGIGPVTAQKIIDNRPYSSIEELRSKKVVGSKVFEDIKDKISTY